MRVLRIKIYIISLSLVALFSSCERDAKNVDIPNIESKLVVQCFIAPQNPKIEAFVSFSSPIFGKARREDWITDATVEITDGTTLKKLILDNSGRTPKYQLDSSEFKIVAGKTYTLFVSTPDGRTVNAKCTVPFPIDGSSLTFNWDTIVKTNQNIGAIERTVRLNMKWRDTDPARNFFRAGANVLVYAEDRPNDIFRERMSNNSFSDLQTDEGKDGGVLERNSLERIVTEQIGGSVGRFSFKPKGIEIYIVNCGENYYKYHKTAENNNGEDPFSEPTLVYSNIIGGLGCFGASNQFIKSIEF
jgi:hypothetical protein